MKKIVLTLALLSFAALPAAAAQPSYGPFGQDVKAQQSLEFAKQGAILGCLGGGVVGSTHAAFGAGCGIGAAVLGGLGAIIGYVMPPVAAPRR